MTQTLRPRHRTRMRSRRTTVNLALRMSLRPGVLRPRRLQFPLRPLRGPALPQSRHRHRPLRIAASQSTFPGLRRLRRLHRPRSRLPLTRTTIRSTIAHPCQLSRRMPARLHLLPQRESPRTDMRNRRPSRLPATRDPLRLRLPRVLHLLGLLHDSRRTPSAGDARWM